MFNNVGLCLKKTKSRITNVEALITKADIVQA